ncbi:MAG: AraC family transcriptional regulator [Clostridiales bacterium 38-18]|nr:MAG: AraC family transcriptional regulator [Clostridiales bacterium 38-18]
MNDIFKFEQSYGAITNQIRAEQHKHWLLQLFIGGNEKLKIKVLDKQINCNAILVNANVPHEFYSSDSIHFTMLIDPTSQLGRAMRKFFLKRDAYYLVSERVATEFRDLLARGSQKENTADYSLLLLRINEYFILSQGLEYDLRVEKVLKWINDCDCDATYHQVQSIAHELTLSESRLSHLFRQETGLTLKGYILLHKMHKTYQLIFQGKSITDAAIASGFDSSSHFSAANKKLTGMSARDIISDSRFLKVIL